MKFYISLTVLIATSTVSAGAQAATRTEPQNADLNRTVSGYSYFNRPGVDEATHDAALQSCMEAAATVKTLRELTHPGGNDGIVGRMLVSWAGNRAVMVNMENCMVARGWRVIQLDDKEGAEIAALPPQEQRLRLRDWLGSRTPRGAVARVWQNEALRSSTTIGKVDPGPVGKPSLSITSLPSPKPSTTPPQAEAAAPTEKNWYNFEKIKGVSLEKLGSIPSDSGVVLMRIGGLGNTVYLTRVRPDGHSAKLLDGREDVAGAVSSIWSKRSFLAFVLPPGRWRFGSRDAVKSMDFCLGSPFFDLTAGETIYAGAFDLGEDVTPNLSLEEIKLAIVTRPDLSQSIKPASWKNGSTSQCGEILPSSYIYAIEFPSFPYIEEYKAGSRATDSTSPP